MRSALLMSTLLAATLICSPSEAGIVKSSAGATASVGDAYVAKFQAYVDDLESRGARILFMGGTRRGKCWNGGLHPCGKALDVCQLSRGRVDRRCNLPARREIAVIAARHGLFEGGQWCNSDYGHAQVGVSAAACGERTLSARRKPQRTPIDPNGNTMQPRSFVSY